MAFRAFTRPDLCAQDASQLRDVPDNQEVWVDTVSDDSLIVECVEYMAHVQVRLRCPSS